MPAGSVGSAAVGETVAGGTGAAVQHDEGVGHLVQQGAEEAVDGLSRPESLGVQPRDGDAGLRRGGLRVRRLRRRAEDGEVGIEIDPVDGGVVLGPSLEEVVVE